MFHFLAAEVPEGPQPKALSRTEVGSKCAVGKAELVRGWLWPPGGGPEPDSTEPTGGA